VRSEYLKVTGTPVRDSACIWADTQNVPLKICFCRLDIQTKPQHNTTTLTLTYPLTFNLLTRKIRWAPNNTNRWQMGFNSAFKGLCILRQATIRHSKIRGA